MFSSMDPIISLLLFTSFAIHPLALVAHPTTPTARITVVGAVYCDTCSGNTFSRSSYFLPGVEVLIKCTFKGNSPKATEQMNFQVNITTGKYGVYKLEIPSVDGVNCMNGLAMKSMCQASLIRSSSSACSVPGLRTTAEQISVKSKQDNLCIYSMNALSFRPPKKNLTLCGNKKEEFANSFNSSKFFLPYFPPFPFPWPQFRFPPLPPLSSLPFPPLPPLPSLPFPQFPFPSPPCLPFPFPPLPPFPPTPNPFAPTPPPAFNLGDPRTWIPYIPPVFAAPPPPPPAFNLRDPRTWIPHLPPSPPNSPQNQNP